MNPREKLIEADAVDEVDAEKMVGWG